MPLKSRLPTPVYTAALILIWAVSWSVRKIALGYAPALVFAGLFSLGGGLLLILVAPARKRLFPDPSPPRPGWRANWPVYLVSGLLNVVVFYGLQTIALKMLPSGLLTVLAYVGPVVAGILASLWLGEPLGGSRLPALLLGFAGVALVSVEGFTGHVALTGVFLGIASGVAWGVGAVYTKSVQDRVDTLQLVTAQSLLGGAILMAAGLGLGQWPLIHWTRPFVLGTLYNVVLTIGVAWSLWLHLVRSGEVTRVSTTIFSVPVLAVAIGILVLGEPFSWFLVGGLACTAAGIYLVNRPAGKTRPPGGDLPGDRP